MANVRPPFRPELAWIGVESNEFGTDEFMKWCEVVGAEPYLALNFGTGTLDEGNLFSQRRSTGRDSVLTRSGRCVWLTNTGMFSSGLG